jgi:predicted nucleic acid-binding protein
LIILVDTHVLIDVLEDDPVWAEWSIHQLRAQSQLHELTINPIIYAELSQTFSTLEKLPLLTRDARRYRNYVPSVELIVPV